LLLPMLNLAWAVWFFKFTVVLGVFCLTCAGSMEDLES